MTLSDPSLAAIEARAAELLKGLDTTYRPEQAAAPMYNRYHRAAAVLTAYDPLKLRPAPGTGLAGKAELGALVRDSSRLAAETAASSGDPILYVLNPDVRRAVLEEMGTPLVMQAALDANPDRLPTPVQQMLEAYLRGTAPPLDAQDAADLSASFQAVRCLEGLVPGVPTLAEVQQRWDYVDLLRPAEFLASSDKFRGREIELGWLRDYVLGPTEGGPPPPLVIYGVGGVGKSALGAKFIQDNAALPAAERFPWAYLDFDRSILDPVEPLTIVIEAVRQLTVQYPERATELERFRGYLRELLTAETKRAQEINRPAAKQAHYGRSTEIETWQRYVPDTASLLYMLAGDRPFLLVLDTFEEVQYRSSRVVRRLFDFLASLQEKAPQVRPVLAGRNPVAIEGYRITNQELQDFEPEAARSVLEAQGVPAAMAANIVAQVGGSPLRLRLAQELWKRAPDDPMLVLRLREDVSEIWLFRRILGHIHDPDVQRLADPGLVLRRLTPDIIRHVLARPCGVRVPDDAEARRLFDLVAKEEALVTVEGDVLRHRPDVRRSMLGPLRHGSDEEVQRVRRIEQAAVRYYGRRDTAEERAEEIYHRLSLSQSLRGISERWTDGESRGWAEQMRRFLYSAREELGPTQRAWLAARLGFELTPEEVAGADQASWEQDVERKVRAYLEDGKPAQALEALAGRARRFPGSPLYLLAVQAYEAQGDWGRAAAAAREGSASAVETGDRALALQLGLRGAAAEMRLGDYAAARGRLDEVAALAGERDGMRQIEVNLYRWAVAVSEGSPEHVTETLIALRERFDALSDERLARDPAVLAWLGAVLGLAQLDLLARVLRVGGLKVQNKESLQALVVALAAWDEHVSREAGEPPGLLARRASIEWAEGLPLSQVWRIYLYGIADGKMPREAFAGLVAGDPAPPPEVREELARLLRLRAGERLVWPEGAPDQYPTEQAQTSAGDSPAPNSSPVSVSEPPPPAMPLRLSGRERVALVNAIAGAFTLPELDELLVVRLGRRRETIAFDGVARAVLIRVIETAEREGWIRDLVLAAREARPGDSALAQLAGELGLGLAVDDEAALDRLIAQISRLPVDAWRSRLGRLERQVCQVEIMGPRRQMTGTGFLLGPEVVLTAMDVVHSLIEGQVAPDAASVRFDRVIASDGLVLREGQVFRLERDWLVASGRSDALGYALLRAAGRPGYSTVGQGGSESYAETRGWIEPSQDALDVVPGMPLCVLHGRSGGGAKMSVDASGVVGVSADGSRFTHRISTELEGVGAPCFDADLQLVGLHLGTKDEKVEGASFAAILRDLETGGHLPRLGGAKL